MSDGKLDFEGLAASLMRYSREFVPAWLPGGHMRGREYVCSNLKGGDGDSLSVNLESGRWADFSGEDKGGDLISLYAAVENIGQGEAARRLAAQVNFALVKEKERAAPKAPPPEPVLVKPPAGAAPPLMEHPQYGTPSARWLYRDHDEGPLFWIARYDPQQEGRKQFVPWSWDAAAKRWVMKSVPAPRPLYGLDRLAADTTKPVLVVEGEKTAEAARTIINAYVVVTWPGGAKATSKVDLTPLHGRKVLLWPDADKPGVDAMEDMARILGDACAEIKTINTDGQPEGWDAADAVEGGWGWDQFYAWAKPRIKVNWPRVIENVQVIQPAAPEPDDASDSADDVPNSLHAAWEDLGIVLANNGTPVCNVDSAMRVLENWKGFQNQIWFDVFHQKILTCWGSETPKEWSDIHDLQLLKFMQRNLGLRRMSDEIIHKAVKTHAHEHQRNEPKDWMEQLVWDGKPRIETFLADCLGTEDTSYHRAVARNFWIGLAARIYRPGCQLDNMMILEGAQGKFKSTALRIIGGPWYAEAQGASVFSKDFFMVLRGKLLIEIGEMASFNKAEIAAVKQVVTCMTDRYRSPYGRSAEDHPRMSVFVGSTNEYEYLRDNTGARRFWPIRCGIIDRDAIIKARSQMFAEAVAKFKKGENWYEMPEKMTLAEQESRRQVDDWEYVIDDFLVGKSEVIVPEIAAHLKIDIARLGAQESRRISNVLRLLGWERISARRGGRTVKVWSNPKSPVLPIEEREEVAPF